MEPTGVSSQRRSTSTTLTTTCPLSADDTDTLAADTGHAAHSPGPEPATWTGAFRRVGLRYLPPEKLLHEAKPAYVASWLYVFGVATLAALGAVIATGGTGDVLVVAIMAVLTPGLLLVPFIPGLRDVPRWQPLHRLIWWRYYREHLHTAGTSKDSVPSSGAK